MLYICSLEIMLIFERRLYSCLHVMEESMRWETLVMNLVNKWCVGTCTRSCCILFYTFSTCCTENSFSCSSVVMWWCQLGPRGHPGVTQVWLGLNNIYIMCVKVLKYTWQPWQHCCSYFPEPLLTFSLWWTVFILLTRLNWQRLLKIHSLLNDMKSKPERLPAGMNLQHKQWARSRCGCGLLQVFVLSVIHRLRFHVSVV